MNTKATETQVYEQKRTSECEVINFCFRKTKTRTERQTQQMGNRVRKIYKHRFLRNFGNEWNDYVPGSCHGSHIWRSISTKVPLRTSSFAIFL